VLVSLGQLGAFSASPFPFPLMRQPVWSALPLGENIVVDPFTGSGSIILLKPSAKHPYSFLCIGF